MTSKKGARGDDASAEAAEELAIEALAFIAGDPVVFNRFLRLTGLELENLRAAASEPAFLAGVLDFILSDERLVFAFAEQTTLPADQIADARRRLGTSFAAGEDL